jgi:hypothetical protein
MKPMLAASVWMATGVIGRALEADPPRFVTNFNFEVRFGDGVFTYNENHIGGCRRADDFDEMDTYH